MLDSITPVLLTYNEAPNIKRTLERLKWAKEVVVVDSGSTDGTLQILKAMPGLRLFHRTFDTHHAQWRYALFETGITTPWVLRLDADYHIPDALIGEMARLAPEAPEAAYRAAFDYAVFSHKLIASLYPPKPLLLRQGHYAVIDDGHTEGWVMEGPVGTLTTHVLHDDWKAMCDWALAQIRYMTREREKLESRKTGLRDWLRMRPPLMPLVVFFYCLFVKGLVFNGRAGMLYTLQRTIAEALLALFIIEKRLARPNANIEKDRP
jgi:glycosyltransferase involved in cell wall biosynthesis